MNSRTSVPSTPDLAREVRGNDQLSSIYPDLLSLLVQDAPLQHTLDRLVQLVRQVRGPATRAAIFVHEPASASLRFAASSGIHDDYTKAVDGFPVAGCKPACGSAAYYGRDEFVEDVRYDEKWQPYLHLCTEYDFRACWSFALMAAPGTCLGTLALYHATPCLPQPDDEEQVRHFAKTATLLIERHLKQQRQIDELRELEDAVRMSTRTAASLSLVTHELRNPLSAISNAVKALQMGGHRKELRDRALAVVERQARQMEWLVEDLIDADRAARNALQLKREDHNLYDILQFAIEGVQAHIDKKQQKVRGDDWSGLELPVNADYRRLAQVFINLLGNASKFSAPGTTITVSVTHSEQLVEVAIEDEGVGLQASDLTRIFQMFEQVDSDAREGLGIGLALVKRLVELHGGTVSAASRGIGQGSVFSLSLPKQQPATDIHGTTHRMRQGAAAGS
jgi:signal transduction histidine kinase